MNPDHENFDSLRRLVALKRHEQPPPGYFDRFSRDVMARIKAGETGGEAAFDLPWMQRVLALFDVKPVFAGAFGMAVCGLLISGVLSSEQPSGAGAGLVSTTPNSGGSLATTLDPMTGVNASLVSQPMDSNTNPLVSLFDRVQLQTQPVSFYIPNNN